MSPQGRTTASISPTTIGSPTEAAAEAEDTGTSVGAIIGIVLAVVFIVALLIVLVLVVVRRQASSSTDLDMSMSDHSDDTSSSEDTSLPGHETEGRLQAIRSLQSDYGVSDEVCDLWSEKKTPTPAHVVDVFLRVHPLDQVVSADKAELEEKLVQFFNHISSPSGTSPENLVAFMSLFGQADDATRNAHFVFMNPRVAFRDFCTFKEAHRLLRREEPGTYLFRFSESNLNGVFAFCVRTNDLENRVSNYSIQFSASSGTFTFEGSEVFESLEQFLGDSRYVKYFKHPLPPSMSG
jgi:SH2 domain